VIIVKQETMEDPTKAGGDKLDENYMNSEIYESKHYF
jgi:hypothetical protein